MAPMPQMDNQEMMPNDMEGQDMGMPPMDGESQDSQFDTGFDAGVEADEDTDPKKFIQQLTGKLSQSLNTFNNENGQPDEELSKYVGKMICKAAAKGLDEKGRKDLIKSINTCEEPDEDFEEEETETEEMPDNFEEQPIPNEEPMQETCLTKKQLAETFGEHTDKSEEEERVPERKPSKDDEKKSIFGGKQ